MTDKEKIRAEIESRLKRLTDGCVGKRYAYQTLLEFIDSLPEELVSEELKEAANNYGLNVRKGYPRVMDETDRYIYNAFKAGAKWQKLKTKKEVIDNAVAWIARENENGGCVYDGWEEDFRNELEKGE